MHHSTSILIIHQGALGDLIMSLPALYSLRLFYEGIPWTMAGNPGALSLLHNRFYAQDVISFHQKEWAWLFQEESEIPEMFRCYLSAFQKAFLFSVHQPNLLIKGLNRAGMKNIFCIPSLPDIEEGITLKSLQKKILESENIPWLDPGKTIFPDRGDLGKASEYLRSSLRLKDGQWLWAIHPGSGGLHKNWPLERFLETAGKLKAGGQVQPVFLSGPAEEEAGLFSVKKIQSRGFPVIRDLSLPLLASILFFCKGYLGNDSGISHLAAAVGIPTVVLFGPTDPAFWSPQGTDVKIISPDCSCAPCDHKTMQNCLKKECLDSLRVERVLEIIGARIKKKSLGQLIKD